VAEIDLPGEKEKIWQRMRDDLKSLVPWFVDYDLLLCPTCLRRIPFEEFSLEHIIPQQALGGDHKTAQEAVTRNQRSGLTLLCSKRLVIKDKLIAEKGCATTGKENISIGLSGRYCRAEWTRWMLRRGTT
jgi:hypothetical protein